MNTTEIIELLENNGYKSYAIHDQLDVGIVFNGAKRLPNNEAIYCDTNKFKISWHVHVLDWKMKLSDKAFQQVEIEICGEKNGAWYKMTAYSIMFDELKEKLGQIENSLLAAWTAICKISNS